ncbi:BolA family transcriptional regulator [Gammaproteobacteria bacterium 45_16_T64]|nr:BolA family transcriptional regulator [Gammaproteobacteria bacterium 45_16_T64]
MEVQSAIENKLQSAFELNHLTVENESHMHNVPANSETHFKVVAVSTAFDGKRAVARHQMIYKVLAEEVEGPVHALAIHTYTPEEWQTSEASAPASPTCKGGTHHDPLN